MALTVLSLVCLLAGRAIAVAQPPPFSSNATPAYNGLCGGSVSGATIVGVLLLLGFVVLLWMGVRWTVGKALFPPPESCILPRDPRARPADLCRGLWATSGGGFPRALRSPTGCRPTPTPRSEHFRRR